MGLLLVIKHLAKFKVPFDILETIVDIGEGRVFKPKNMKLLLSSQQGNASFSSLHILIKTILPHSLDFRFVHSERLHG